MKQKFQPEDGWIMPVDGIEILKEGTSIILRYNEKEVQEEGVPMQVECEQIIVQHPVFYNDLVSRIIRDRYSDDSMQAIINNHLLEANDEEHEQAYNEMQEYRAYAKTTARAIIDKFNN